MKTIKNQIKLAAVVLSVLILFQGCVAYKSQSYTLEQASKEVQKVKVITKSNEMLKFRLIGVKNGLYYGVKKHKGIISQIALDPNWVHEVKIKDKTLSAILTIAFPIGIIAGAALIFQDAFKWKSNTVDLSF